MKMILRRNRTNAQEQMVKIRLERFEILLRLTRRLRKWQLKRLTYPSQGEAHQKFKETSYVLHQTAIGRKVPFEEEAKAEAPLDGNHGAAEPLHREEESGTQDIVVEVPAETTLAVVDEMGRKASVAHLTITGTRASNKGNPKLSNEKP
jgi:hypothetical protein